MVLFEPSSIGFQDPATPIMEGIVDLHNYIFFYLVLVFVFVLWVFMSILIDFYLPVRTPRKQDHVLELRPSLFKIRNLTHSSNLEIVWTLTPSLF